MAVSFITFNTWLEFSDQNFKLFESLKKNNELKKLMKKKSNSNWNPTSVGFQFHRLLLWLESSVFWFVRLSFFQLSPIFVDIPREAHSRTHLNQTCNVLVICQTPPRILPPLHSSKHKGGLSGGGFSLLHIFLGNCFVN